MRPPEIISGSSITTNNLNMEETKPETIIVNGEEITKIIVAKTC